MLQCVAVCCSVFSHLLGSRSVLQFFAVCCIVLQYVLRCVAGVCSVVIYLRSSTVVLQCVAVWCSTLQCVNLFRGLFHRLHWSTREWLLISKLHD